MRFDLNRDGTLTREEVNNPRSHCVSTIQPMGQEW